MKTRLTLIHGAFVAGLMAATAVACAAEPRVGEHESAPVEAARGPSDIRHVAPVPDSVGAKPARFEWTAAEGAESYTLRVWNEADVRIVSESGLTATSIAFPAEYELPLGTYFWAVVAMRDGRPVAESGLAAFVVTR